MHKQGNLALTTLIMFYRVQLRSAGIIQGKFKQTNVYSIRCICFEYVDYALLVECMHFKLS